MPSEGAHIRRARRNQEAIGFLLANESDIFPEWITAIAFYKALHLVEAVFAADEKADRDHEQTHDQRERRLKRTRRYREIYKHYAPLCRASLIARYMQSDGKIFADFTSYLTPEQVVSEVLNHRLKRIERAAKKFMSAAGQAQLGS